MLLQPRKGKKSLCECSKLKKRLRRTRNSNAEKVKQGDDPGGGGRGAAKSGIGLEGLLTCLPFSSRSAFDQFIELLVYL